MLNHTKVYLCGPIETSKDPSSWRNRISNELLKVYPEIKIWDPLIKPRWVPEDVKNDDICFEIKNHIYKDDRDRYLQANSDVRRICKQLANKCDWMVARITKQFTWGSIDELEIAINRRIPIFLLMPDGLIGSYGIPGVVYDSKYVRNIVHFDEFSLLNTICSVNTIKNLALNNPEVWMSLTWTES